MMKDMAAVLVIDTCGAEGYVAVLPVAESEPPALSERRLGVPATQEELLPAIESVLAEAGVALPQLQAVAVVSGPGSFTGVRIGLATAKGLCEAADLPLVALSRLQVLADAVTGSPLWAWLQAGRGDVYAALFASGGHTGVNGIASNMDETLPSARVLTLDEAIAAAGEEMVAVCEEALRTAGPGVRFVEARDFESSLRVASAEAVRNRRWSDVALADAVYLRVPDAELALRARQA